MRWTVPVRGDIRRVADRAMIYDRMLNNNRIILDGHGSPVTYWRNTALNAFGQAPDINKGAIKCYCWDENNAQPDKRHYLCHGTGWLTHLYQKYGYMDYVFSTPSPFIKSTNDLIIGGARKGEYVLSGSTLDGTLTTDRILFDRLKAVTHVLINDYSTPGESKIIYEYTLDDNIWIPLTPVNWTSMLSNKIAYFSIPETSKWIRFRITLRKRYSTVPSPRFNYIRFRYQQLYTLNYIDPRFNIDIPAFLASRENPTEEVVQGEYGWTTERPYRWWCLPEADIENDDIIMFLTGEFMNQKFETKSMVKYTHGPQLQLTHKSFESKFIRDKDDLLGILESLI